MISGFQTVCLVLFLILSPTNPVCAEANQNEPALKCLSFAEHLFSSGDYYRARGEYLRFCFRYPSHESRDYAWLMAAVSLAADGRTDRAVTLLLNIYHHAPHCETGITALGIAGVIESRAGKQGPAFSCLVRIGKAAGPPAAYAKAVYFLMDGNCRDARRLLSEVPLGAPFHRDASRLIAALDAGQLATLQRPERAALLEAVFPGAGHLYAGQPDKFAGAVAVNGLFITAVTASVAGQLYILAGIVAFFEITEWYLGGISAAGDHVKQSNRRRLTLFGEITPWPK